MDIDTSHKRNPVLIPLLLLKMTPCSVFSTLLFFLYIFEPIALIWYRRKACTFKILLSHIAQTKTIKTLESTFIPQHYLKGFFISIAASSPSSPEACQWRYYSRGLGGYRAHVRHIIECHESLSKLHDIFSIIFRISLCYF